jgi:hypothetical protein
VVEWDCNNFFSKWFGFPLAASSHQCSIIVFYSSPTDSIILKIEGVVKLRLSLSLLFTFMYCVAQPSMNGLIMNKIIHDAKIGVEISNSLFLFLVSQTGEAAAFLNVLT